MSAPEPTSGLVSARPIIGLEIHVELSTKTKMFSRCPSPAAVGAPEAAPNTLIDPVTLGLPGSLPVMNAEAVERSMMVGLALGCSVAGESRWDRKSYFYPDLPKGYQVSQYELPLCYDGSVELPKLGDDGEVVWGEWGRKVGIIRAHLEEDTGKLLHEAPGGGRIDGSILDLNRAGTPLLEIVTQPDFSSADEVVLFARVLRNICRFLGVSEGVMQKGHIRFEPNINAELELADGRRVRTPVVEVKNLNSFRSVRNAIEFELREQPGRWAADGLEMGPGMKTTRGWDEARQVTFVQREKEDAQDYRYFPEPDLVPVIVDDAWMKRVRDRVGELPLARMKRYMDEAGLTPKEAAALTDERDVCFFYEDAVQASVESGVDRAAAGKQAANFVLQSGMKRANERTKARIEEQGQGADPVLVTDLGISAKQVAQIVALRERGEVGSTQADELFGMLCEAEHAGAEARAVAEGAGLLMERDTGKLEAWVDEAIAAQAQAADDVRAGKQAAIGRLIGAVMQASGGKADAKAARELILKKLSGGAP